METITLAVPTVHCTSCKLNIEESLAEVDGITHSDVNIDAKQVTVTYDPQAVSPTKITTTVEDAGYPVSR